MVFAEEVHLIADGSTTPHTEFGVLTPHPRDVTLIPRPINYRIVDVQAPLTEWWVLSQRPAAALRASPPIGNSATAAISFPRETSVHPSE